MGKLTKAERDTLVKRIQSAKSSTVMGGIGAVFMTVLLILSSSVPVMILLGIIAAVMLIIAVECKYNEFMLKFTENYDGYDDFEK